MEIDSAYEGREHSVVKHALLKGYLEKLLFIMGRPEPVEHGNAVAISVHETRSTTFRTTELVLTK